MVERRRRKIIDFHALLPSMGLFLITFLAGDHKIIGYIGLLILLFTSISGFKNGVIKSDERVLKSVIILTIFTLCHFAITYMTGTCYEHTVYYTAQQIGIYIYLLITVSCQAEKDHIKKTAKYYAVLMVVLIIIMAITNGVKALETSGLFQTQLGMFTIPLIACIFINTENKIIRFISLFFAFAVTLIAETRSALFGLIMFTLIYLFGKKILKNKKRAMTLFIIIVIFCIVVPIIYLQLNNNAFGLRETIDAFIIKLTGARLFSGRDILWPIVLNKIQASPIIGNGIGISLADFSNETVSAHNLFLFILLQTGIIGLLLFIILLYNIFKTYTYDEGRNGDVDKRVFAAFMMGVLLHQTFSLGLLTGKMGFAIVCWTIMAWGIHSNKAETTKESIKEKTTTEKQSKKGKTIDVKCIETIF